MKKNPLKKEDKIYSKINKENSITINLNNTNKIFNQIQIPNGIVSNINKNNQIPQITSSLNKSLNMSNSLKNNTKNIISISSAIEESRKTIIKNSILINTVYEELINSVNQIHKAQQIFQNININQVINQYNSLIKNISPLKQYFLDHETEIKFGTEIEKILDESPNEIKQIFHTRFLNTLIVSEKLWILPRITEKEYKKLSKINLDDNNLSLTLFEKYINQPELITEIISNWKLNNPRKKIIRQIYDNYILENYETVIIMLTTQIEGIFLDKLDLKKVFEMEKVEYIKSSKLRIELEEKVENSLDEVKDKWEIFLKKCNITFLSYILKPLYDKINFIEDDKINRHQMFHKGTINLEKEKELNQIIAIRFFLILDTLMFIFDDVI